MRDQRYAVVRHDGQWGIKVAGAPFLSCESYELAVEIAVTAAELLRGARAQASHTGRNRTRRPAPDQEGCVD